ncbi:MAG: hypothetical protein EU548_08740 [Promethearchaeota archaeon]|nr:MAG: hypothetical protein EU548_08740 [Candidatus Lokiarchaeota archaeon]
MLKYKLNTELIFEIIRSKDSLKQAFERFKENICAKCGLCSALMNADNKIPQQQLTNKQTECFFEHFTK